MFAKLRAKLLSASRAMIALNRSPRDMAKAMALGLMTGISPFLGFRSMIVVGISALTHLPVYPMMISAHFVNFVTIPFVYTFTTRVGIWMLHKNIDIGFDWENISLNWFLDAGRQLLVPFLVGSMTVAIISIIPTYLISYFFFDQYHKKKMKSRQKHTESSQKQ